MVKNSLFPIPAEPLKYDTYADFPSILPDGTLVLDLSTDKLYTYDLSTNTYLPVSSGGQVNTIVAGIGISVDDTDPINPIVSNTIPIVTPAGSNTELQFNNGGSFGADAQLTFDYTNKFFKTYFTDGATFGIETTNNALGFGVKASILTETDGTNTSLIGTFDNTTFGGAVVNSGIVNINLSTGITSFIVNDGSISCSTPSGNFTAVNDTDGIVLSSSDGLPNPIQFYLSGNMVAKFKPTGKLSLLNRGIYDDATLNFSSDGSDPSVYVEGDVWRNGDRLFFVKSTGAFDIANQITIPAGSDTEIQFNKGGVFGSSSLFVYDYTNNVMGIGAISPLAVSLLDIGGSTQINAAVYPRVAITSNANRIECMQLQNKHNGTAAEMRFIAAADDNSYVLFTQPSSGNTGTFFGATKNTGSFIIAGTRKLFLGTNTAQSVHIGTGNNIKMTVTSAGDVGIGTSSPQELLEVRGSTTSAGVLYLTTGRTAVVAGDTIGQIAFNAPVEASGSDARLIGAFIRASAEQSYTATVNSTSLIFATGTSGSATEKMRIMSSGYIGIGTNAPSEILHVVGNIFIDTDSNKLLLGAGKDMSLYYNGTNGYIKTDEVAASDLHVACGTDKTIVLDEPVWDDIQFQISSGRTSSSNYPDWSTFTTNTSEYEFDVNDYIDIAANEMLHWWQEGTLVYPHIHVATNGANVSGSSQYAKFKIYIAYADENNAFVETDKDIEIEIPTGTATLTHLFGNATTLDFTGITIGTQVKLRVKRIAATTGTEYPNKIFITQVGFHCLKDTMGSRQIGTK